MKNLNLKFASKRDVPAIQQTEQAECGLVCLLMIANHYGQAYELREVRERFPISNRGTTLARLIEIAGEMNLAASPLKVPKNAISKLKLPCILHWRSNHFVVLTHVSAKEVFINDPASGARRLSLDEAKEMFSEVALAVEPSPEFEVAEKKPEISYRSLLGRVPGLKSALARIFMLALALECFALAAPLFIQITMDQVIPFNDGEMLRTLAIGFIILLVVQGLIGALRSWVVTTLGAQLSLSWSSSVFGHLMRLPENFFLRRNAGDVISKFGSVNAIQQTLSAQFVEVMLDGLMVVATLALMAFYNVWLCALTVLLFSIYALIRVISFEMFRRANLEVVLSSADQQNFLIESIRASQLVRLYNMSGLQRLRYNRKTTDTLNNGLHLQRLNVSFGTANFIILGIQRILTTWLGAELIFSGQLSVGMLVAFLSYSDQFVTRSSGFIDYIMQFRVLRIQKERLADIMLNEVESHLEPKAESGDISPSVVLRNVSFKYTGEDGKVIDKCNFEARAGESVGIVGASGAGKTTLAKIILGLLDPTEGEVLIGGVDIRSFGKKNLRDITAAVMQDDTLLQGSIVDNISLFEENPSLDAVREAARMAGIHDEIMQMPMEYRSMVGDMGGALSGGQKQRLILARALYRQPKILVLDEATSHLDVSNEMKIGSRISELNMTRIIIAHRPETIATVDRVFELSRVDN